MLKIFRKKIVSRIILWGLLILILPAFVMWGSASMSGSKAKGPKYVGIIDNKKISFEEFYIGLTGVRTQVILNYFNQPKVLETIIGDKALLAKLAWDRVILLNEAKKLNTKVSDKEVIEALQKHPLFIRDGVFDPNFYTYVLRNNIGLEPRAFEEIVRDNIAIQKLSSYITKDLKLSDEELLSEYKKDLGKIKIEYVLIEPKSYLDQVKIGEGAAREFYDNHKNELIAKANIKGMGSDRIATFEESKETIENYLKEIEARKILKNKAGDIYKKIFERLQGKNDNFGHAASGLGLSVKNTDFFSRTDTLEEITNVPIVIEAAYGLKDLELSKPVEISKGFIIFEVVQRKGVDEESFKKEKDEYAKKVRERKTNIAMEDWLKKAEDKASLAIKLDEAEKYYK